MKFDIDKSVEILQRTPLVLKTLLHNLSEDWTESNEGPDTWSARQVIAHMIQGEKEDWIVRVKIILSEDKNKVFEPFDRFSHLNDDRKLAVLLDEFEKLRKENLSALEGLVSHEHLNKTALHPELGHVNLTNLLSTWVTHDLTHLAQISRTMAKQYKEEVGPWIEYIGVLNS